MALRSPETSVTSYPTTHDVTFRKTCFLNLESYETPVWQDANDWHVLNAAPAPRLRQIWRQKMYFHVEASRQRSFH